MENRFNSIAESFTDPQERALVKATLDAMFLTRRTIGYAATVDLIEQVISAIEDDICIELDKRISLTKAEISTST